MGVSPPIPKLNGSDYIIEHLDNMGWCGYGFSGILPLTFTEINNYIQSTKTPLTSYEVKLIRKMSVNYVSQSNNKDPHAKAPYSENSII